MTDQTTPATGSVNEASRQEPVLAAAAASTKSGGKGLGLFAILLSLLALGASGYLVYQAEFDGIEQENKLFMGVTSIGSDVAVLAERMEQLQRAQRSVEKNTVSSDQLKTRLLESSNQNDLVFRDIKEEQKNLRGTLERLSTDAERGGDKLALEEVSQLLKLANNSAVFAGDKNSAINALKLADSQLKQLSDPRYSVVRRTINQEIGVLEAIESVDVVGVTSKLDALANKIASLPLENEPPVVGELEIAHHTDDEPMTFASELKKLWVDTLNTVKIKRIDQPPKPLLAPEQRYFLDQNIQLKLNTAELAVLKGQSEIYKRSLAAAIVWLQDYFDPRDADVRQVISDLQGLANQALGGELPSVAGSYDQLQRIKGGN